MKILGRIEWKCHDTLILIGMLLWAAALIAVLPYDRVFYRGDMTQFAAMEYALRDALKQGQWPLWNPYFMEPLMANPQTMALYPPHLLLLFLPVKWLFPTRAVLHIWLAGAALYLLLRHWGFSRTACLAADRGLVWGGHSPGGWRDRPQKAGGDRLFGPGCAGTVGGFRPSRGHLPYQGADRRFPKPHSTG